MFAMALMRFPGLSVSTGGFNALMWLAFILCILSYQPLGNPSPQAFNLGVAILIMVVIILSSFFCELFEIVAELFVSFSLNRSFSFCPIFLLDALVDFQASRVMASIRELIPKEALLLRNGELIQVPASELVRGDIVKLSLGMRVPADLRLVDVSSDLKFDRSLLTGETDAVRGTVHATDKNPLESYNVALSSTFVVQGSGTGVVVAIGDETVMGTIARLSTKQKDKITPIQKELLRFTIIISAVAVSFFALAIVFWAAYINRAYPGFLSGSAAIINAIGILTAFVPQGLPLCVALAMTIIGEF